MANEEPHRPTVIGPVANTWQGACQISDVERIARMRLMASAPVYLSERGGMQDQRQGAASARYRRLARECLEIAKKVQSEEARLCLLEMARVWARLAEERQELAEEMPDLAEEKED